MDLKENIAKLTFSFSVMLKRYKDSILGKDFQKLTLSQYFYLRAIGNLETPTFGELAEALNVSRPTITIVVGKLARLGFVVKEHSDSDARFSRIVLTDLGRKVARADYEAYDVFVEKLRANLSEEEMVMIGPIVKKIVGTALECAGVEDRDVNKLWIQYTDKIG